MLDTEHTTKSFHAYEEGFYLTCCGWVDSEGGEGIVWFDHTDEAPTVEGITTLQTLIDGADVLGFHHAKHDINVLKCYGLDFEDKQLHCTMVTEYLLRGQDKEASWKLEDVAQSYGLGGKFDEVRTYWDRGIDTYDIPAWILGPYCVQDCWLTMQILELQRKQMMGKPIEKVVNLQNEFTYALSEMELNGFKMNVERAEAIIIEYSTIAEAYAEQLREIAGEPRVNLGSPMQLSALLYGGILKLSWLEWTYIHYKTKPYTKYYEKEMKGEYEYEGLGFVPDKKSALETGYFKTDKKTLEALKSPTKQMRDIKRVLIGYSKAAKVHETLRGKTGKTGLLTKIQQDGLVHPKLNQAIAATGRLTSSDPNGQNLPRGNTSPIKKCIIPTLDGIMQVDLSQIEWRAAAWLSQDPVMVVEVNDGVDQHVATVKELMELTFTSKKDPHSKENRDHAKVFNFRMIYGGTEWGFFLDVDMPDFTIKKWRRIIKAFFLKYAALKQYHQDSIKTVLENGYLTLPTGRWFKFHKIAWEDGVKTYKKNQIKNFPVQGISGGDFLPLMCVIIRRGMKKLGLKSKLMLTVHDSIVFDYLAEERDALAKLCYSVGNNLDKYISNYFGLDWNVKLECEVEAGPTYGDLEFIPEEDVI